MSQTKFMVFKYITAKGARSSVVPWKYSANFVAFLVLMGVEVISIKDMVGSQCGY